MSVQIECRLEILPQRAARRRATMSRSTREKVPRITRTLVLAHQIERAVQGSRLLDYAEVARQMGVSRARISQIVGLVRLAPAIQARILHGDSAQLHRLAEAPLRRIFIEPEPARQVAMFGAILDRLKERTKGRRSTRKGT